MRKPEPTPRGMFRPSFYLLLWTFALLIVAGCDSGRPRPQPVSGMVTLKGQPIEGAQVMLFPEGGRTATGLTDAAGKYALTTFEANDGALPGDHRVTIIKNVPLPSTPENPYPGSRNELPSQFANPEQSGLTLSVPAGGRDDANFDLTP